MSNPFVCTCCCAMALSTTTGGSGAAMPRPTALRISVKPTPNAASQFAWQHSRLPVTGTSCPCTLVNSIAGPPSRFLRTPATARCGSIGAVYASSRPAAAMRSSATRKRVSRTVEFEIMRGCPHDVARWAPVFSGLCTRPSRDRRAVAARARWMICSLGRGGLEWVLHGRILVELDVVELAVAALDLANVDVLDDVARLRVDRDRATRAFPRHSLHRGEQRIAAGVAAGLLQRRVDQMHGVVHRDADVVGAQPVADPLEAG